MHDVSALRITVVQPDVKCDLDRLGRWLEEDGIDVEVIRPFDGDEVPSDVDADALVVLGGSMGAGDHAEFPYIAEVAALMRTAVAADVPTLGVCLGAQILATAMGGEVEVGSAGLESGVVEVELLDSAAKDPLLKGMPTRFAMPALHFDAVTRLPESAVLLGTGSVYANQIFRVGSAWGLQFHLEITPGRFREWQAETPAELHDLIDAQAEEFDRLDARVGADARRLARRFVTVVAERAAPFRAD